MKHFCNLIDLEISRVAAARKVSPDWSQETMTFHSSSCFSIVLGSGKRTSGDFSSEQLLHDPLKYLHVKITNILRVLYKQIIA